MKQAMIIFTASLALSNILLSVGVVHQFLEHQKMKTICEAELGRNESCIVGYFPMEVVDFKDIGAAK